jgi:hypothetical protein
MGAKKHAVDHYVPVFGFLDIGEPLSCQSWPLEGGTTLVSREKCIDGLMQ